MWFSGPFFGVLWATGFFEENHRHIDVFRGKALWHRCSMICVSWFAKTGWRSACSSKWVKLHLIYNWVMSHIYVIACARTNGECAHTHELTKEISCRWHQRQNRGLLLSQFASQLVTYQLVMSHMWMSHATHVNESCCLYNKIGFEHIWASNSIYMYVFHWRRRLD